MSRSRTAQGLVGALAGLMLACGAAQSPEDRAERCAGASDAARNECRARGCYYGPEAWCGGFAPPDEWDERRARGELDCACTCTADIQRCGLRP